MPMRHARHRHLPADAIARGLEALEPRRVLDAASCTPACDKLIEITRLDGAESFFVRADDPDYGVIDCDNSDQPGEDSDLYSFTIRSDSERPRDVLSTDEPGDDHDLYDFGQDRGPEIDDEAEYQTAEDPAPVVSAADFSSAPADSPVILGPAEPISSPIVEEPAPIALIPGASKITWIGEAAAAPATVQPAPADEGVQASWTDLAALPEPVMAVQV